MGLVGSPIWWKCPVFIPNRLPVLSLGNVILLKKLKIVISLQIWIKFHDCFHARDVHSTALQWLGLLTIFYCDSERLFWLSSLSQFSHVVQCCWRRRTGPNCSTISPDTSPDQNPPACQVCEIVIPVQIIFLEVFNDKPRWWRPYPIILKPFLWHKVTGNGFFVEDNQQLLAELGPSQAAILLPESPIISSKGIAGIFRNWYRPKGSCARQCLRHNVWCNVEVVIQTNSTDTRTTGTERNKLLTLEFAHWLKDLGDWNTHKFNRTTFPPVSSHPSFWETRACSCLYLSFDPLPSTTSTWDRLNQHMLPLTSRCALIQWMQIRAARWFK